MLLLIGVPPAIMPGLIEMIEGGGMTAACTVKPPGTDGVALTVTSAGPTGAPDAMLIGTVTLVAVAVTTGPGSPGPAAPSTVIPSAAVPMVTVEPMVQLVYWPVMVMVRPVWPGLPMLGLICVITGVPAVTVKLLGSVRGAPLVVTVMPLVPTVALAGIVRLAVTCVMLLTVTKFGAGSPPPKLTEVKPCWKVVNWPLITTFTVVPA